MRVAFDLQLDFDPKDFEAAFEKRYFRIRHNMAAHPLFQMPALMELAQKLPDHFLEFNAGDVPESLPEGRRPAHNFSAVETIERIREAKTWLGLKRIEIVPEYRAVLEEFLALIKPYVEPHWGPMYGIEGFVFVTSPNSTVPYHMDPEHNFLLQLQGEKHFTIFDKSTISEVEREVFYGTWERKMALAPDATHVGETVVLKPGEGMHVPITAPHFVRNNDEVSISISVNYQTPRTWRRSVLYRLNHRLRGIGIKPAPVGDSETRDSLKMLVANTLISTGVVKLPRRERELPPPKRRATV